MRHYCLSLKNPKYLRCLQVANRTRYRSIHSKEHAFSKLKKAVTEPVEPEPIKKNLFQKAEPKPTEPKPLNPSKLNQHLRKGDHQQATAKESRKKVVEKKV